MRASCSALLHWPGGPGRMPISRLQLCRSSGWRSMKGGSSPAHRRPSTSWERCFSPHLSPALRPRDSAPLSSAVEAVQGLPGVCLTLAYFARVMRDTTHIIRLPLTLPALDSPRWQSPLRAFAWGLWSVTSTVLTLVLFATYIGIGALAHDTHFSLGWVLASTALVWAGPAQIILISTLGSGATIVQAAIAVTLSAIRLFPMVVSVLPTMRMPDTKRRHLVLATHFIAVTLWVECFRLLPQVPRERRIAFTHGLGIGLVSVCLVATAIGYG